jgi:hypothetical protein
MIMSNLIKVLGAAAVGIVVARLLTRKLSDGSTLADSLLEKAKEFGDGYLKNIPFLNKNSATEADTY